MRFKCLFYWRSYPIPKASNCACVSSSTGSTFIPFDPAINCNKSSIPSILGLNACAPVAANCELNIFDMSFHLSFTSVLLNPDESLDPLRRLSSDLFDFKQLKIDRSLGIIDSVTVD